MTITVEETTVVEVGRVIPKTDENKLDMFKVMGHAERIRIMWMLTEGKPRVTDLYETLNLPQSTVSQHLGKLKSVGAIKADKNGLNTYYEISDKNAENVLETLFPRNLEPDEVEGNAKLLFDISHKMRMEILLYLNRYGETNVSTLQQEFGVPQSTMSQQLTVLRQNLRLIKRRKKGLEAYHSVKEDKQQLVDLMEQIF